MSQPQWRRVWATDYSQLFVDETGVYAPELEVAQEIDDAPRAERFQVFRFSLDKLKIVRRDGEDHLVCDRYRAEWPHPVHTYVEWFAKDLKSVAATVGTTKAELIVALTGDDINARAGAYESIASHHGYNNFDDYPLTMSEKELNARWSK
jgi:hypothetical protein